MERERSGNYRSLLDEAFGMGCSDRPATDPGSGLCGGLEPEEFAALLWAPRPGPPPAGLVLNAPHWYAAGLRSIDARPAGVPRPRQTTPRTDGAVRPRT